MTFSKQAVTGTVRVVDRPKYQIVDVQTLLDIVQVFLRYQTLEAERVFLKNQALDDDKTDILKLHAELISLGNIDCSVRIPQHGERKYCNPQTGTELKNRTIRGRGHGAGLVI